MHQLAIAAFMGWELPLEAVCKGGGPSSEIKVVHDGDDTSITIRSRPHWKEVQWVALKEY